MPKYITLILLFTLAVTGRSYASDDPDILGIFDQFITSSAAAGKCEKPTKETLSHFLANLQMVSSFSSKKLKEKYPEYSKENISKTLKRRSDLITKKVNEIIDDKGCADSEVQEIIKRFYMQSKWKPGQ